MKEETKPICIICESNKNVVIYYGWNKWFCQKCKLWFN